MYYPFSATMTRTRDFFTWPVANSGDARSATRGILMDRTLDSTAHLGDFAKYRQDYKAMVWGRENLPEDAKILEKEGGAYSHDGRMSTGTGRRTVLGWEHHEHQWRGRAKSAPTPIELWFYDEIASVTDLETTFANILRTERQDLSPNDKQMLFRMDAEERKATLTALFPDAKAEQIDQMSKAVDDADGLTDLTVTLKRVDPTIEQIPESLQRALRLSDQGGRIEILHDLLPERDIREYYKMERLIAQEDISMVNVTERMKGDIHAIYLTPTEDRARELIEFYDIDYVVVGEIERKQFMADAPPEAKNFGTLDDKLTFWGFEKVYDSLDEEWRLPMEASLPAEGTSIYKVPNGWREAGGDE
jgi:hypothetical protein